mmetsp:Transcript_36208/g.79256  ORF Transcript_36208/g.79256 Transcript_36208/m.79256 type:complete len:203 (-) Transcript_36208:4-612(-)|eukprot:CAMPEP_0178480064 /NCGR_PEP_ID=MMETSP0696-20121128/5506_1 /TAXON_ID=265572 /ORGANISM="Extubocellulus spinifer, Strain CCMP396" /LENGTH=202 /DNA_ID=CAMNT_0020107499 /DNA_START=159 /DNA_END=767 /DNA_ORIENTATION=-
MKILKRQSTCDTASICSELSHADDPADISFACSSAIVDINDGVKKHQEKSKKSVRFDMIEIREYPYVLGDNPSVSNGPPLSVGWQSQSQFFVNLEEYDDAKAEPRSRTEMRFDGMLRVHILQRSGHTMSDIVKATAAVRRIQQQRQETIQSCTHVLRFQNATKSIRKKLPSFNAIGKRSFSSKEGFHSATKSCHETQSITSH